MKSSSKSTAGQFRRLLGKKNSQSINVSWLKSISENDLRIRRLSQWDYRKLRRLHKKLPFEFWWFRIMRPAPRVLNGTQHWIQDKTSPVREFLHSVDEPIRWALAATNSAKASARTKLEGIAHRVWVHFFNTRLILKSGWKAFKFSCFVLKVWLKIEETCMQARGLLEICIYLGIMSSRRL